MAGPSTKGLLRGIIAAADPELEALGEALPEVYPVDSSFISMIGFEPPGTITVTFKDTGKTYAYAGDRELFDAFASAPSKGQFFNQNLR